MGSSIVRRVALGAALAASGAAFLAAFATIVFASYFLQQAEDRRLEEAVVTFATELSQFGHDSFGIQKTHRDESEEMKHTGILFAVYDSQGSLLAGDERLELPTAPGCVTVYDQGIRVSRASSSNGLIAVAGAAHTTLLPVLSVAAVLAALCAALLAWIASSPISQFVVAPLTRLRERIAALDVDAISASRLGADEQIAEVDALRQTIGQLIGRIECALAQALRFSANAAHELRTPLASVRAELELLAERVGDPSVREEAQRAQQKLAELALLVERLLILSMPTTMESNAHEVVSLRDLLEDVAAALPAEQRRRVSVSEEDAIVLGDAALLATMVTNGISNGLKFGERVDTQISVVGSNAILWIDDDGPGLSGIDRERAFEPFFRSDDAFRRRLPGHGLGLALIRHIARTHGGEARLLEKPQIGARLEIRLPMRSLDRMQSISPSPPKLRK